MLGSFAPRCALHAQEPLTGRIVGRIIDAQTGRGLSDAGVQVVGTTLGAMSQLDGRFSIAGIPEGTVSLHVRLIGYQPKTVTGILLGRGQVLEQHVSLQPIAVQLAATVVTASDERGSVNEALDAQRNAIGIVSAVTAEQIAKSPDGDAAAAVQRVSGVTVQDGRYVFVRGLGERYTTTSLNGSRIPSPEPERKVVPLDLFPSSLLQTVTTLKTFTPDQPGDFSGAQVDIRTREFPARRQFTFSSSLGYNDRATGTAVPRNPAEHLDWLGFGGAERRLPGIVGAAGALDDPSPSRQQVNQMVGAFRDVWTPRLQSGSANASFGVTAGGSDPLLGHSVGYIGSLTYSYQQEVRADETRAFAVPDGDAEAEVDRFEGSTGRASVLWGGVLNLGTLVGSSSRISLNNTYTRSADSEAKREVGIEEDDQATNVIQRLRYVERSVWASQLAGEHELGARHRLEWSLSGSGVRRYEPDRSEIVYRDLHDGQGAFWLNDPEAAVRTFSDLTESSYGASGSYALRFGAPGREHVVQVGGSYRYTTRDSETNPYSITANLPLDERRRPPEEIFDGRFSQADDDVFRVTALLQGGAYDAMDVLNAGYGMLEYQLSERLRFIGGARIEYSWVDVDAIPTFGTPVEANPTYTDVLPSAALTFQLNETQHLRASLSQTLARPEYREIAPIAYRTVLAGEIERGNPELRRTLIQNADVRWEWYPNPGEVLSVALFAKRFQDPIERIYRGTSGTRVTTFINADEASNFGVELELRKGLGFVGIEAMTAFGNVTVMRSDIRLRGAEDSFDTERPMVGQAPFVVNAGLTYASESGTSSATLLYNVVGRRIYSAALLPLPNIYEEARHVVDVSLRFPLVGGLTGTLDGKNLLDDPYEVTQGAVTREFYRAGRVFSVGFAWRR
ncbi:MAG TPA: TonB-dependent receptor [Gemmatimonadaceae bacterium]|nr:TonB-dependent receptor [Gemmatimonadaceae bacterium]